MSAAIKAFRRSLVVPVAERLTFVYAKEDDAETIELRTLVISTAAACEDPATLAEYKRRFGLLLKNNDESEIPSDLRGSIFAQSVKHGGAAEYEKVRHADVFNSLCSGPNLFVPVLCRYSRSTLRQPRPPTRVVPCPPCVPLATPLS